MCATCGCSTPTPPGQPRHDHEPHSGQGHGHDHTHTHDHEHDHGHDHDHPHDHAHDHGHDHGHAHDHDHPHDHGGAHDHSRDHAPLPTLVRLEQDLLAKNGAIAERNRGWLSGRSILALNFVSSPGAGKTTLLERLIRDLRTEFPIQVIEGDQATERDAERIRKAGAPAVQINTGTGCHLDAEMVARGLGKLDPRPGSFVAIENVGNLVCPALFDLGERAKVLVASVTEGEDKPLKYPHLFRASEVLLLNKIDLLPHVTFDVDRFLGYAREVQPRLQVFPVSAVRGDGLDRWYGWLREQRTAVPVGLQ